MAKYLRLPIAWTVAIAEPFHFTVAGPRRNLTGFPFHFLPTIGKKNLIIMLFNLLPLYSIGESKPSKSFRINLKQPVNNRRRWIWMHHME